MIKNVLCGICFFSIAFTTYAHDGRPIEEAVTAEIVQNGVVMRNETGHSLILRSITCDNERDISIQKTRKAFGKTHKQHLNTISIQDNQTLSITPPNYHVENIHNCRILRFNFGPAGSLTLEN